MSLKRMMVVILAVCSMVTWAAECQAQNTFRRRKPLRWLGQGFSDGYHRKNPGHDTSYYNPYSVHNSTLISQSPQYNAAAQLNQPLYGQQPVDRFFVGVPFSVYAAPADNSGPNVNTYGLQVESSFTPLAEEEKSADNRFDTEIGSGTKPTTPSLDDLEDSETQKPMTPKKAMHNGDQPIDDIDIGALDDLLPLLDE